MKTNETKYSEYGMVIDADGAVFAFDVTACDIESAKADVLAAYPTARIVQVCCR